MFVPLFSQNDVLGVLDDYPTRSGYLIAPVVVWLGGALEIKPNPGEVAAAYRIRCAELFRPDSPEIVPIPESDRPIIRLPLPVATVNAPTAAVGAFTVATGNGRRMIGRSDSGIGTISGESGRKSSAQRMR